MSSRWTDRLRYALSFRLALWYGVLFVISAVALVALTYLLLAVSLETSDREAIQSTLERYATDYRAAGLGVDAASLTGAARLYERAGMYVTRIYQTYELELRPGDDLVRRAVE